jgi:hypothetical protein
MSLGPEEALRQLRQINDRQRRGIVDLLGVAHVEKQILQDVVGIGRSFSDPVERSSPIILCSTRHSVRSRFLPTTEPHFPKCTFAAQPAIRAAIFYASLSE